MEPPSWRVRMRDWMGCRVLSSRMSSGKLDGIHAHQLLDGAGAGTGPGAAGPARAWEGVLVLCHGGAGCPDKYSRAGGAGVGWEVEAVPLSVPATQVMGDGRGAAVYGIGGEEKFGGAGDPDVKPGGETCAGGFHMGENGGARLREEDKRPVLGRGNRDPQGILTEADPGTDRLGKQGGFAGGGGGVGRGAGWGRTVRRGQRRRGAVQPIGRKKFQFHPRVGGFLKGGGDRGGDPQGAAGAGGEEVSFHQWLCRMARASGAGRDLTPGKGMINSRSWRRISLTSSETSGASGEVVRRKAGKAGAR